MLATKCAGFKHFRRSTVYTMTKIIFWCLLLHVHAVAVLTTILSLSSRGSAGSGRLKIHASQQYVKKHAPAKGKLCFEDKCRCVGDSADCSRNYGRLTFIPRLPKRIRFLNFSHNRLTDIKKSDFFTNVSGLKILDLGENNLQWIHPDAFRVLTQLNTLFLNRNNKLSLQALHPVLTVTTLWRLELKFGKVRQLPDDLFLRFPLPKLHTLQLFGNRIKTLNFSIMAPLSSLASLGLANNEISDIESDFMVSLERLNLQLNRIFYFPVTCRNGSSLFPRLTHLFLAHNSISTIPSQVCLPRLRSLELTRNALSYFLKDMFNVHRFPSLTSLYLQNMNQAAKKVAAYAFRNPSLTGISLMYSNMDFGNDNVVHPDCFSGSFNLTKLQLSHSRFDNVSGVKWQRIFKDLGKLQSLYMGNCLVKNLSADAFSSLPSLTTLVLHLNSISSLPDGVFDGLNDLTHLDLCRNRLSAIKESTFNASTRGRLKFLDLSGNPFDCSCDLLWFQGWFKSNPGLFSRSWTGYECKNLPGTDVASYYMNLQACLLSHAASIFIVISVAVVMLTLTLVSVLYRYRWHIRLLLYEAFRGRGDVRRRRQQERHFDYDLFVSYAVEDSEWVFQRLRPELEGRLGLRLCLHQRDFIPGKNIVDNIEDSVQSSKKVLMVFSTNFARSQWCQFELALCLHHVMDNDDALLIVCLDDVAPRDLTSTMMAVYKTTTVIQWGTGSEVQASFWGRLHIALNEIVS